MPLAGWAGWAEFGTLFQPGGTSLYSPPRHLCLLKNYVSKPENIANAKDIIENSRGEVSNGANVSYPINIFSIFQKKKSTLFMQLFSVGTTVYYFFAHENLKRQPKKLLIIGPIQ